MIKCFQNPIQWWKVLKNVQFYEILKTCASDKMFYLINMFNHAVLLITKIMCKWLGITSKKYKLKKVYPERKAPCIQCLISENMLVCKLFSLVANVDRYFQKVTNLKMQKVVCSQLIDLVWCYVNIFPQLNSYYYTFTWNAKKYEYLKLGI